MSSKAPATHVSIQNVSKSFGTRDGTRLSALEGINATVGRGSFVTIVGPSGCGKSTLLNIVSGLVSPTHGTVEVDGTVIHEPRRSLGVIFQEESTLPWRNVLDNVRLGLEVEGRPRREQILKAQEMIDLVGLSGFGQSYPRELSGGMRQRVAIARALALDPDMLLMDEPFGALDPQTRLMIGVELLRIWQDANKTILFVTHDIQEAVLLSQEIWVMSYRPGTILQTIDIPFEYPRSSELISTDSYQHISGEIWRVMRRESQRAFDDHEGTKAPATTS